MASGLMPTPMMGGVGMGVGVGLGMNMGMNMGIGVPAVAPAPAPAEPPKPVEFTLDIDINHSSQKHILTRGTFVDQLCKNSGADVRLKGTFRKIGATNPTKDECLHLHIVAKTEDELKAAETAVKAKMGDPPLPAYIYSEMVRLGCEVPYGFDAVSEICGPDQSYISHIEKETTASLLLVGRGAPQHQDVLDGLAVYVGGKELKPVQDAAALVSNLLDTVRQKCQAYVPSYTEQPQQQNQHIHPAYQQPHHHVPGTRPPLPSGPAPPPGAPPPFPPHMAMGQNMVPDPAPVPLFLSHYFCMCIDMRAREARRAAYSPVCGDTNTRIRFKRLQMHMAQQMQAGMMGGMQSPQAMAVAQGISMGMAQMPQRMGAMSGAPAMGGMARAPPPASGGAGQGKYNMVAPPSNLMMEHNKLMDENQVDGQGMQMLSDAPQENRHGADYFQRDDHQKYENYDRASGPGKRRFREDDDLDSDRGRGGARVKDREDSLRDGRGGPGGRRSRLSFTEEDDAEEMPRGRSDGGGGEGPDRGAPDPKANAAVIAARLEAKLKAKHAQGSHALQTGHSAAGKCAADLLNEPPCVISEGADSARGVAPDPRPPVPAFAAPAPPSKPPVPSFAGKTSAQRLELTFGGAPLAARDASARAHDGAGGSYDPASAGEEDVVNGGGSSHGSGDRGAGKTGVTGFGCVDRVLE